MGSLAKRSYRYGLVESKARKLAINNVKKILLLHCFHKPFKINGKITVILKVITDSQVGLHFNLYKIKNRLLTG
jgi:hypothetical protein